MEEDSLVNMMVIANNRVPLEEWDEDSAISAVDWWFRQTAGTRHVHGRAPGSSRKRRRRDVSSSPSSEDEDKAVPEAASTQVSSTDQPE